MRSFQHFTDCDLPNGSVSLKGNCRNGDRMYLALSIARKLYICPQCDRTVEIGTENVLVFRVSSDGRKWQTRQHFHRLCARLYAKRYKVNLSPCPRSETDRYRRPVRFR